MKQKVLLFLLFMVFSSAVYAQQDTFKVWNKWCSNIDSPLLFNGAYNEIKVVVKHIPIQSVSVKSLDYALKIATPEIKGDTISFLAMPYPKGGKRMRLAIINNSTKKPLKTISFSNTEVPAPLAKLGNLMADHVTKKELFAQTQLKVYFPGSYYNYPYRVKEYTFKTRKDGKDIVLTKKGANITYDISSMVNSLPEGTYIEFTDITITCPECNDRKINTLGIWIK